MEIKTKVLESRKFNFSDNIIEQGYILANNKRPKKYSQMIDNIKKSTNFVFAFDYYFEILEDMFPLFNDGEIRLYAIVGDHLKRIQDTGFKHGLFRNIDENLEGNFILIDPKEEHRKGYYVLNNQDCLELDYNSIEPLLQYFNYLFWNKCKQQELLNGGFSTSDNRFSVLNYNSDRIKKLENLNDKIVCSNNIDLNPDIISEKDFNLNNSNYNKIVIDETYPSIITNDKQQIYIGNSLKEKSEYYVQLLSNETIEPYINAYYFKNKKYSELRSKQIFINNKKTRIKKDTTSNKVLNVNLKELFNDYQPDYDQLVKEHDDLTENLEISVELKPIYVDETYKESPNYKYIQSKGDEVNRNIEKAIELIGKKKVVRELNKLKNEKDLRTIIEKFNEIIDTYLSIGDKVLTKKDRKASNKLKVNFDRTKFEVPPVGTLYIKNGKKYIAVRNYDEYLQTIHYLESKLDKSTIIIADKEG